MLEAPPVACASNDPIPLAAPAPSPATRTATFSPGPIANARTSQHLDSGLDGQLQCDRGRLSAERVLYGDVSQQNAEVRGVIRAAGRRVAPPAARRARAQHRGLRPTAHHRYERRTHQRLRKLVNPGRNADHAGERSRIGVSRVDTTHRPPSDWPPRRAGSRSFHQPRPRWPRTRPHLRCLRFLRLLPVLLAPAVPLARDACRSCRSRRAGRVSAGRLRIAAVFALMPAASASKFSLTSAARAGSARQTYAESAPGQKPTHMPRARPLLRKKPRPSSPHHLVPSASIPCQRSRHSVRHRSWSRSWSRSCGRRRRGGTRGRVVSTAGDYARKEKQRAYCCYSHGDPSVGAMLGRPLARQYAPRRTFYKTKQISATGNRFRLQTCSHRARSMEDAKWSGCFRLWTSSTIWWRCCGIAG